MNRNFCAITALLLSLTAHAATNTVSNTNDSGPGTLRAALGSVANGDTINFSVTGTITLTNGQLVVNKSITILGPGPGSLAVNGNFPNTTNRVFYISPGTSVAIAGLTITNGSADFSGGGIYNDHASLTVSNCTLSRNSVVNGGLGGAGGGGLYNDGGSSNGAATVLIVNSTLTGNSSGDGGAIYNEGQQGGNATLSIIQSTLNSNSADNSGGAIYNDGFFINPSGSSGVPAVATVSIQSSTFSGNSAGSSGGGIYNAGIFSGSATLTISASTFSGNTGGGIYNDSSSGSATVHIGDTILKAGTSGANLFNDSGTITSHGYNLSSDNGGGFLTATGDKINTDPLLGPLANNGGPTLTHALLPGSPAIDRGVSLGLAIDQRGFPRTVDDLCLTNAAGGDGSDIGAFELQTGCDFRITAIAREANNLRITWAAVPGKTNVLERTPGIAGSFTNNFAGITNIFATGTTTNVVNVGAATNAPALYYRVRLVP